MDTNIETIVFVLLLVDALGANILAFSRGRGWWQRNAATIARYLPMSRGWTTYYLFLVVLYGIFLVKNGLLVL